MPEAYKEPTHLMEDAFRIGIGSISGDCELCNRHIFCTNSTHDYEPGEVERLRKLAREQPEKYVEDATCDSVSFGKIDGRQFILGCDCHRLRRYEDWIWGHRLPIMEYLKARCEEALKDATDEGQVAKEAYEAVERLFKHTPRRVD